MRLAPGVIAFVLLPACTCSPRPHVAVHRDGGPVVVVVDRRPDAGAANGSGWRPSAASPGAAAPPAIDLVDEKEPDDDLARAQVLEYPKGIHGTLSPPAPGKPDVDLFQWIPAAPSSGNAARVAARIELDGPADATLDVLDKDGAPLLRALPGEHLLPNLALTPGEVCFLRVRAGRASTASTAAGSPAPADYRLVARLTPLQPGDEEEPNDSAERANQLVAAVEETGFYGRVHDEDWLKLPEGVGADKGATLRLELSPVEGVIPSLRVRDAAGVVVAEARGGRGDELRLRNAPAPAGGTVVIRAEGGKNLEIPWRLRLASEPALDGAEVEPNGTADTATPLTVEGTAPARVAGFLWPGDVDLYRVQIAGGGLVEAVVESPSGVEVRVEAATVSPPAPKGEPSAGGAGGRSRRLRALATGGELLLRVAGRPRDTAFEAPYTLTVTAAPPPAAPASPPAPVAPPPVAAPAP